LLARETPPFLPPRPTAARHLLDASPAGSGSARGRRPRQGGRRSSEGDGLGDAGRAGWLWEWLEIVRFVL